MTSDTNQLLLDVTALAREAGRAILEVYASSFSVKEKEDRSPLTEADLRSEKLILAGLRRIAPEIPVLSEESVQLPNARRVPHFAQRFGLNLTNAFAGHPELASDFFKRPAVAIDQPETLFEHLTFTIR